MGESLTSGGIRRFLAICALLFGVAYAWWLSQQQGHKVKIAWLLSHVQIQVGDRIVERDRLVRFAWQVVRRGEVLARSQRDFAAGQAPDAIEAQEIQLPADVSGVEIACDFQLLPASLPLRSKATVHLDRTSEEIQTIDVGACGTLQR